MNKTAPESATTRRPWLWIVGAFAVLMCIWAAMVTIAVRNVPQNVPLIERSAAPHADH
jgi:hypothetical protein